MDLLRIAFDMGYDVTKPFLFWATKKDPEVAHELLVKLLNGMYTLGVDGTILDNSANRREEVPLSNAAGFNKNGDIPPQTLQYLGFDRVNVGTVTYDQWEGNPRPRVIRIPETESVVNWLGLPGVGAKEVAKNLNGFGNHGVPITINLMSTPGKSLVESLRDIEGTVRALRENLYVDRFEVNISCPNTHNTDGTDTRDEYQSQLGLILRVVSENKLPSQDMDVKVSPDMDLTGIEEVVSVADPLVDGYTIGNTTKDHQQKYVPVSPEKGGASGNAVYNRSFWVQREVAELTKKRISACGGINSRGRLEERVAAGATEIQLYTPLIYSGPKLLRELRS